MRLAGPAPTSVRKPLAARSRPAGVSDAARPTSLARWSGGHVRVLRPHLLVCLRVLVPERVRSARQQAVHVGLALERVRRVGGGQAPGNGGAKSEAPPGPMRHDRTRRREHRLVRLCRPWRVPTASVSASRVPAPRRPREPEHGPPGSMRTKVASVQNNPSHTTVISSFSFAQSGIRENRFRFTLHRSRRGSERESSSLRRAPCSPGRRSTRARSTREAHACARTRRASTSARLTSKAG